MQKLSQALLTFFILAASLQLAYGEEEVFYWKARGVGFSDTPAGACSIANASHPFPQCTGGDNGTGNVECRVASYPADAGGCARGSQGLGSADQIPAKFALQDNNWGEFNNCTVGNPVDPVSGRKTQHEPIIVSNSKHALEFSLYYNSMGRVRWRHTYSRSVKYIDNTIAETQISSSTASAGTALPGTREIFDLDMANISQGGLDPLQPSISEDSVEKRTTIVGPTYSTRQEACESGWGSFKNNYRYMNRVADSTATYIGFGRCRIYEFDDPDDGIAPSVIMTLDVYDIMKGLGKYRLLPYLQALLPNPS